MRRLLCAILLLCLAGTAKAQSPFSRGPIDSQSGSASVSVNGSTVTAPNVSSTTPAAETGYMNAKVQASGSDISIEIPGTTGGGTEALLITESAEADGDIPQRSGGKYVNAVPGNVTSNKTDGGSIVSTDRTKRVYCTGAGPVGLSLAQAGADFPDGWPTEVMNIATGNCTITATTSKIYSPSDPAGAGSVLVLIPGAGAKIQSDGTNYHAIAAGNTVSTAQFPTANKTRTCVITVGDGTNTIADADISPFKQGRCQIPYAATVFEVDVVSDAGTPNVIVAKRRGASTITNLVDGALATGGTTLACASTNASKCVDGSTNKSGTVAIVTAASANVLAAGDYLEVVSGAGSTAKALTIAIHFTVN